MHRSGTSALAGTLSLLGAEAPKTLFSDHWNPKGHFESVPIIEVSNAVLRSAGLEVEDWGALPAAWPEPAVAAALAGRFAEVARAEFSEDLIVVKDPRFCRFPRLVADGLSSAGWQPCFVLIYRDPVEVARSLGSRNSLPLEHNLLIWLRSVLDAERGTRGYPRVFLSYDFLMGDWRGAISLIERELGILLPQHSPRAEAAVDSFLETELRHFKATGQPPDTALKDWLVKAWDAHVALGRDATDPAAMASLDEVEAALTGASLRFHGLVCELAEASPPAPVQSSADQLTQTVTALLQGAQQQHEQLIVTVSGLVAEQTGALRQVAATLSEVPRQIVTEQSLRLRMQEEFLTERVALLQERLAAREAAVVASMVRAAHAETAVLALRAEVEAAGEAQRNQAASDTLGAQQAGSQQRLLRMELAAEMADISRNAHQAAGFARAATSPALLLKLALTHRERRQPLLAPIMAQHQFAPEIEEILLSWLARRRVALGLLRRSRAMREALVNIEVMRACAMAQERLSRLIKTED